MNSKKLMRSIRLYVYEFKLFNSRKLDSSNYILILFLVDHSYLIKNIIIFLHNAMKPRFIPT